MAEHGGADRGALLDVTGAVLASVLAFVAVPAALVLVVGDPLTTGLGHTWPAVPRDTLCLLALAAWVAWAACCAQLVRTVIIHVRRGEARVGVGASLVDRMAARIALGILALTGMGAAVSATAPATAGARAPLAAASGPAAFGAPEVAHPWVVGPGDTLAGIAESVLDDPSDWTLIARLNLDRTMADGARLIDPDLLRPGWRLELPAVAHPPPRPVEHRSARAGSSGGAGRHLPELVALGMGSLACAALARQAACRRGPRFTGGAPLPDLSDRAVDAAVLVQRFAGVPALDAFEAANVALARALEDQDRHPVVRAVSVGSSGVTFHLQEHDAGAPEGFAAELDGAAWHVGHETLDSMRRARRGAPYVPVVFPVGDDADGTWLVALQPGTVLPLFGESAPALWRAARAALRAWAWSDTVLIVEDAADAALVRELQRGPAVARHLVYFGDPGTLSPDVVARCAVVSPAPAAASDLSVLVDRRAATVHPLGRVLRPHLQSAETARALNELVADTGDVRVAPARSSRKATGSSARSADTGRRAVGSGATGRVDVRLLTPSPRLDGLAEELPTNRARRAVELVAYLALQRPDVVTGDRLRTRVLGSADADAAAKTLFNTAHAARRAMGADAHGELLFPAAGRDGLYRISPEVTVDVQRAAALAGEGSRHAETRPEMALAHLKEALDLVEGEPLAHALTGYSWWETEGHGGRTAAVLVEAACTMATLATARGQFELARWGLTQARLVAPYSEALSRAAMRTAGAEGDAERLRAEWRECQRLIDALDPGSTPSPRTESLFGELNRALAGPSARPYAPVLD